MCIRCFFWKILGTHIHRKGIDIDLVKAKEIQDMEPPKSDEELKSFMESFLYAEVHSSLRRTHQTIPQADEESCIL